MDLDPGSISNPNPSNSVLKTNKSQMNVDVTGFVCAFFISLCVILASGFVGICIPMSSLPFFLCHRKALGHSFKQPLFLNFSFTGMHWHGLFFIGLETDLCQRL